MFRRAGLVRPITHDDGLFGRLVLEMNQAGLSWLTILKKKETVHLDPPWARTGDGIS